MSEMTPKCLTMPLPVHIILITALVLSRHVALGQDTTAPPEMTTAPGTEGPSTAGTADPPVTEGTCEPPGTPKASPITINTFGCGGTPSSSGGPGGGGGNDDLEDLEDKVQQLTGRVSQLETYINVLLQGGTDGGGGGGGGGGDGGPTGGGGGGLPQIGRQRFPDCEAIRRNGTNTTGTYEVWPRGAPNSCNVLCDFSDAAQAMTVIHQRVDDTVVFQRSWTEYKNGFGDLKPDGNFWVGLDCIHYLTRQAQYRLRLNLGAFNGQTTTIEYGSYSIGPESDRYRLKVFFYDTTVSAQQDSFGNYHNYIPFSTFDLDNDYAQQNCAYEHGGGWWYRDCDNANLNGNYINAPGVLNQQEIGIEWDAWQRGVSLASARMSIYSNFKPNVNFPGVSFTGPP